MEIEYGYPHDQGSGPRLRRNAATLQSASYFRPRPGRNSVRYLSTLDELPLGSLDGPPSRIRPAEHNSVRFRCGWLHPRLPYWRRTAYGCRTKIMGRSFDMICTGPDPGNTRVISAIAHALRMGAPSTVRITVFAIWVDVGKFTHRTYVQVAESVFDVAPFPEHCCSHDWIAWLTSSGGKFGRMQGGQR